MPIGRVKTMHWLTRETPGFIDPTLWPANRPDFNPVNYTGSGASYRSQCTAARFMMSSS